MTTKKSKRRAHKGEPHGDAIADPIIGAIEKGDAPWMRAWNEAPPLMPRHAISGRPFYGLKFISTMVKGFEDPRWCTYAQASGQGWQVQKNPRSVKMIFIKSRAVEAPVDAKDGEELPREEKRAMPFYVFNAEEIKGVPEIDLTVERQWGDTDILDSIVTNAGIRIVHGASAPRYDRDSDVIEMPNTSAYPREIDYYADLMREMARWTGGPERLNRNASGNAEEGAVNFVMEELRVSFATLMLCTEYGLPFKPGKIADYSEDLVELLQEDRRAIGKAAIAAKDVCDYISQFGPAPDFLLGDALESDDGFIDALGALDEYEIVPEKKIARGGPST